ncbi:methionine adenosyltransferase 2 subunit beta-like [Clytia hemisphaerica]|uniref:Methionine adenosyltransferase 2 subunit beta n=1 Tax=Clytia hemisphaerica TaxID=252671 RepID=A0A7M5XAK5_9CNID
MKVLITGASGLLGRAIKKELEAVNGWKILGLGFTRLNGGLKKVDLTDSDELEKVMNDFQPDVVVHSAAERRPDVVGNKETETVALNIKATEHIAKLASKLGSFLIYISTDYVFDGSAPPYTPNSKPNPLNRYGQTKFEGEKVTASNCERHAILRVPILYGEVERVNESAVTGLLVNLKDTSTPSKISNYELRYPTFTEDVAVVCRQMIQHSQTAPTFKGIFHWQGNEQLTKYQMVKIMSKVFNLSMDHLEPVNGPTSSSTPRPYHCQLDCSGLEKLNIGARTSFEGAIKRVLQKFV